MPKTGYLVLLLSLAAGWWPAAAQPAPAPATPAATPVAPAPAPAPAAVPAPVPAAAFAPAPSAAVPPAQRQHAPIAVAIVVDQLASWVLRERIDRLPPDGGFARLRREGKYFPEVAFAHAITETGPGHASLFTGKTPREHGIVANDVLVSGGKLQSMVAGGDEAGKLVGLDGKPASGAGSSLDLLEAKSSLVAEVFRSRYPRGQGLIAALSLKDRGALFAAGENADIALWFDPKLGGEVADRKERGGFVTSKRYEAALAKSGLLAFLGTYLATDASDRRDGIARIEEQAWKGLDPAWLTENTGIPGDSDYSGFVFAHTASQAGKPGAAFRALPESDRLLLEMALRILKTESRDLPVFLSVSLSANDYVGHLFGPDSWEAWDQLRRLDATLAWFFKGLDELGPQAWSVVLSADHGVVPLENTQNRPACGVSPKSALDSGNACSGSGARGARIHGEDMHSEAERAATKAGLRDATGKRLDKIIAGVAYPYIYLTKAAKTVATADPSARGRLASRLDGELRSKFKSVHAILDVAPFKGDAVCPDERKDRLTALVCNSVSPAPDKGGDFYLVLKPGAFLDPDLIKGTGANHGSPYGYDRFVPLFVRDPSRPALAGQVDEKRTPFTQFRDELVRIILGAPSMVR
jgi:hypothetical protein